ncbi:MAG: DUF1919 domain-containing protein [Anaerolineales bacterium]
MQRIKKIKRQLESVIFRQRVKQKDFTIVSVDCWGSSLYQELGLPYNTPFVGLFFYAPCYITLLQNFASLLSEDIAFSNKSKYAEANEYRATESHFYPIGLLGGAVEIHFLHYQTEEEAREKWRRRRARMNMENLFFEFSDRNLCVPEHLSAFDALPYPRKIVFTAARQPNIKSSVWLPVYQGKPHIGNIYTHREQYKRYFDAANWLNGGDGQPTPLYKILQRTLQ